MKNENSLFCKLKALFKKHDITSNKMFKYCDFYTGDYWKRGYYTGENKRLRKMTIVQVIRAMCVGIRKNNRGGWEGPLPMTTRAQLLKISSNTNVFGGEVCYVIEGASPSASAIMEIFRIYLEQGVIWDDGRRKKRFDRIAHKSLPLTIPLNKFFLGSDQKSLFPLFGLNPDEDKFSDFFHDIDGLTLNEDNWEKDLWLLEDSLELLEEALKCT